MLILIMNIYNSNEMPEEFETKTNSKPKCKPKFMSLQCNDNQQVTKEATKQAMKCH